jgi:flagellar motor component MotA
MIRYFLSLIFCFIGVICGILFVGNSISFHLNIYSFIIIGLFPIIFTGILFGFKETFLAFSVPFKRELENNKLLQALHFLKIYNKTIWIIGIIAVIIVIVAMLRNLTDKSRWGPFLAFAFNSILYCGIINMVIIIPFTVLIKRQIKW